MEFSETFKILEKKINIEFKSKDLLYQAFTHRSFLNENPAYKLGNNERLEFLGDAVLELIVSIYLFESFPDESEGMLTSYRSAIVRTENLAEKAQDLELGSYLLLSKGEKAGGGETNSYLLANTFEALIGAIYLDQGMEKAQNFLNQFIFPSIHEIIVEGKYRDSKSTLQEVAQKNLKATPVYRVVEEIGPDHDKTFVVKVMIKGITYGLGKGKSKQEAQQEAASNGIKLINDEN